MNCAGSASLLVSYLYLYIVRHGVILPRYGQRRFQELKPYAVWVRSLVWTSIVQPFNGCLADAITSHHLLPLHTSYPYSPLEFKSHKQGYCVVFVVSSKNSAISELFATVCHWNNTSFSRAIWKEVGVTNLGETKITLHWHRDNALITCVFIAKPKILCLLVSSSKIVNAHLHVVTCTCQEPLLHLHIVTSFYWWVLLSIRRPRKMPITKLKFIALPQHLCPGLNASIV